ncbi:MAG TPA: hypothetical protein PLN35_17715, partial [Quisquiliibacterium sp.]|nr:hypothetical protein [Quisquiliibacterium sp.]
MGTRIPRTQAAPPARATPRRGTAAAARVAASLVAVQLALTFPLPAGAQETDWFPAWQTAMRQRDTTQAAALAREAAARGDPRGKQAFA